MEIPQEGWSAETEFSIMFLHSVSEVHKSAIQMVDNNEHYYDFSESHLFLIKQTSGCYLLHSTSNYFWFLVLLLG